MGIVLNDVQIMSYAIPSLTSTKINLQTASNDAKTLLGKLPRSFSQRGVVSDIVTKLKTANSDVENVKKLVKAKVSAAKMIESRSTGKVSTLISQMGNSVFLGAASGATASKVTSKAARQTRTSGYTKTGAKVTAKSTSLIGTAFSWLWGGIKKVGSTVANGVKSVVKGVTSAVKKVGTAIATGAKKVASGISSVAKGLWGGIKNIGTKIASGAKSFWNGVKNVGAKIASGAKSLWNGIKSFFSNTASKIKEGVKAIWDKASGTIKKIGEGIVNLGKNIASGIKRVGTKVIKGVTSAAKKVWDKVKKVGSAVWSGIKKAGATIAQGAVALTEGVVKLGEALVDTSAVILTGIASIGTGAVDLVKGVATGNWDWSATKGMWNGSLKFVGTDWTGKAHDWLYETEVGKWLDNNAVFKSNGKVFKIVKATGYVAGAVTLTVLTCGVAAPALGSTLGVSSTVATGLAVGSVTAVGTVGKNVESKYQSTVTEMFEKDAQKAFESYVITDTDRSTLREKLERTTGKHYTDKEVDEVIKQNYISNYIEVAGYNHEFTGREMASIVEEATRESIKEGIKEGVFAGVGSKIVSKIANTKIAQKFSKIFKKNADAASAMSKGFGAGGNYTTQSSKVVSKLAKEVGKKMPFKLFSELKDEDVIPSAA